MNFTPRLLAASVVLSATLPALVRADQTALIAEGARLVRDVGLCADCHTPRLPTGQFDESRWLQGSVLGFKPLVEMPWAPYAPPLVGLPGYTEEQAIKFLMTGERPAGTRVLPPMPPYRLNKAEAEAVVAYLRSLAKTP